MTPDELLEATAINHDTIDKIQAQTGVKNVYSNYPVSYHDDVLLCDTSAANVTVTLPLARGGKEFIVVKNKAANVLTVLCSGADTIFGAASLSMVLLGDHTRLKSIPGGYITI